MIAEGIRSDVRVLAEAVAGSRDEARREFAAVRHEIEEVEAILGGRGLTLQPV